MPEYRNSKAEEADRLTEQSSDTFEQGDEARHHADDYVRETVMLATVLLLTAISQRFKVRAVRTGLIVVAGTLLCTVDLPYPLAPTSLGATLPIVH